MTHGQTSIFNNQYKDTALLQTKPPVSSPTPTFWPSFHTRGNNRIIRQIQQLWICPAVPRSRSFRAYFHS